MKIFHVCLNFDENTYQKIDESKLDEFIVHVKENPNIYSILISDDSLNEIIIDKNNEGYWIKYDSDKADD
ncbi:hypothetical protein [Nostoc sp. UHCC 0252]|uniref:hypothetical protein n=1 Tax=Nostoc sp. UHCC 0252 TaxID=3110241 RepID=UPI002B1EAF2A|nr:hypothetical protein [Nostoc sp. UHCC 0252]MEA5606258.1 hypothetical protein [Nostoc sp. UHCC 0252]